MPNMTSLSAARNRAARFTKAILILLVSSVGMAHAQGRAPFIAEGLGHAGVAVGGLWQFHPGDDPAWAAPDFDDSGWRQIEVGRPWEGQGYRDLTGFAWYRRHVVLPAGLKPGWELGLRLTGVEDAAEVYWNGRLVGGMGKVPPDPVWTGVRGNELPAVVKLGEAAQQQREGELAIRVWKAPYAYLSEADMGGLTETPVMGDAAALEAGRAAVVLGWWHDHLYGLGIMLLSTVVSLLALTTWSRDRQEWLLLWLAGYTIRPLALLVETLPGVSWRVSYGCVGMVYSATDVALWFLLTYLLGLREHRRLLHRTKVFACIAIGCQVLEGAEQLFDWTRAPHFFLLADVGLTIPSLLLQMWPVVLIVFALRKRLDGARWLVAILGLLADLVSNWVSWFDLGNRWTHWTLAQWIETPLFTIDGNAFNAIAVLNTLFLLSIVFAVWRYEKEQRERQTRLDEEFRNAQELQQLLIPESLPVLPGMEVTSAYRPATEVGGDFFQVIPLEDGGTLLVVGDVSGKGLHAAMTVAMIVGALRSIVETTQEPAAILEALNRRLHGRLRHGFATCVVARVHADGTCVIANAGHLPPFVDGRELTLPGALPLGIVAEARYEAVTVELGAGERLAVYTDGLLEARNAAGELFGFDRLAEVIRQSVDASAMASAAQDFGQEDDITVLTLALKRAPAKV